METVVRIAQLLLSLSILVIFHELGHFTFAKLFKTRVEKFYLFFNPWFSLFKVKKGETEYGIGWVPLGGYVKISGMIDESMDKEQMKLPPQPWEFRSKPAWQRLLIMVGGVMVNVILAVFIYIITLYTWGETYLPTKNMTYGISADSLLHDFGFENGDKLLKANGEILDNYKDIYIEALLSDPHIITVDRQGNAIDIRLDNDDISKIINEGASIEPRIPFVIADFAKDSPAEKAGFQVEDKIIGFNGNTISFFDEFKDSIQNYKSKSILVTVLREDAEKDIEVTVSAEGLIGVQSLGDYSEFFELKTKEYSLLASVPAGIKKGYEEIKSYLKQLKMVFTPETGAYKQVGSFISIGKIFPGTWDWEAFWSLTALLSIMLAVVNILPIPALDGGHVMFLIYEIIVGKKPSDKFMEYAQIVGMVLLLTLMVLALGNDFIRHVFN
jgi:regulator of sigma E protease